MEYVELTNMCLIENLAEDTVLVQNRIKGNWTGIAFPGGHLEQGEAIVDSVIREIKEETGLTVKDLRLCGIKDWYNEEKNRRYLVFLFKTSTFEGEIIEQGDEGQVSWVRKDDILNLKLAHGFDKMLEVFLDNSINEYFIELNHEKSDWLHVLK